MLVLDAEALSAVAHGPAARRDLVRALIAQMRAKELPVATVAAVLAEVIRGRAVDAAVFGVLKRGRVRVHPVDTRTGVRAGQLLGKIRQGSELAIDAFVVAAAELAGGALVATSDPDDLERLAAHASHVRIVNIS